VADSTPAGPRREDNGTVGNDPWTALFAIVVILILALVMRWVFKPSRPHRAKLPVDASASTDLGLLTVVATGMNRQDAMLRRAKLGDAGIRSSMSKRRDGRLDILVFDADADTARDLLDL
jgi:hypothetical protein